MINSQGRIQLLNPCPVLPNPQLEPVWRVLARLAGLGWPSELDAFKAAQARAPRLAGLSYRAIGPQGHVLAPLAVAAGA